MSKSIIDKKLNVYEAEMRGEISSEERNILLEKIEESALGFYIPLDDIFYEYGFSPNRGSGHGIYFGIYEEREAKDSYFKVANNESYEEADRVLRVRFLAAEGYDHRESGKELWRMNNSALRLMDKMLRKPFKDFAYLKKVFNHVNNNVTEVPMTYYQALILLSNHIYFHMTYTECIEHTESNKNDKYPDAITFDYLMPDYTKLVIVKEKK